MALSDKAVETYVGLHGETEVLVTVWGNGTASLAYRTTDDRTWGPPTILNRKDEDDG